VTAIDPATRALMDERNLLLRRTHRLGGPLVLTIFGGAFTATGIGGLAWGLSWCRADADDPYSSNECEKLLPWGVSLGVGVALLGVGIWRVRVKLRRREAQQRRMEEIDRKLLTVGASFSSMNVRLTF
jgi:hypothetical protein